MSRSPHSFGSKLLKALALLCLVLAAPLVLLILIQLSGLAGPGFLYAGSQFLGDRMLIAVAVLLGVALLSLIALVWTQARRNRRPALPPDYGRPERNGDVPTVPPSPDLTFHQCAMKIQFKLTHLEEKVNDLETALMRRAADLD